MPYKPFPEKIYQLYGLLWTRWHLKCLTPHSILASHKRRQHLNTWCGSWSQLHSNLSMSCSLLADSILRKEYEGYLMRSEAVLSQNHQRVIAHPIHFWLFWHTWLFYLTPRWQDFKTRVQRWCALRFICSTITDHDLLFSSLSVIPVILNCQMFKRCAA